MQRLTIGLMSGTSLDGVDGALVDWTTRPGERWTVLAHAHRPFSAELGEELLALNSPGPNELHRAALAANALVGVYAEVVGALLATAGVRATAVQAIGTHGQTVRHRPGEFDGVGYTLQINQPALLAERCGIDVVADFRARDVSAGGQGAPLVPAFHRAAFARHAGTVAVLNLGGIGNLTVLQPEGRTIGFDCGPANALLDHWFGLHHGKPFDEAGSWAASGRVLPVLLASMQSDPYFALPPPKSTGRDLFHPGWLANHLRSAPRADAADVQATLAELTAWAAADAVLRHASAAAEVLVCGGGALNRHVMARLAARLSPRPVVPTDAAGVPATQVEAVAFAWLAEAFLARRPGNLPSVTGAAGPRVLGALYPAGD